MSTEPTSPSTPIVPTYAQLPTVGSTGERSSWGVFGADDQLGTLNFVTPDVRRAAAATVQDGLLVTLALPLDEPRTPLGVGREPYRHEIMRDRSGHDDRLDAFFLQGSTQWDGLAHVRFREFGYYNGHDEDDLDAGRLGVDALARHGIVSRGVLIDWAGWAEQTRGSAPDPTRRTVVTPAELDEILAWQGTVLRPGDVVVLRTGWLGWYQGLDDGGRSAMAASLHNGDGGLETPGLDPGAETAAWLWDHRVAAIAADNPSLEALKVQREAGFLHRRVLSLLGMPIGEFWVLDALSRACRERGRYQFLLSASPLVIPRAAGSPVTPQALL